MPYVANYGHISIVEELIVDRDAEINARDDEGRTALRWASAEEKFHVAAFLSEHGGLDLGVFENDDDDDDDDGNGNDFN